MPKAFLLTNKRYKIWKKIKETFKEEQKRRLIEQEHHPGADEHFQHVAKDDHKTFFRFDDTTDYSKYTNVTDDEGKFYLSK